MEIRRYVNGKPVTQKELSALEVNTPELLGAVRDVRRRVRADGNVPSATMAVTPDVSTDE